ncbi:MAG: PEGA domain-containing protein [Polyangiales bacterium]
MSWAGVTSLLGLLFVVCCVCSAGRASAQASDEHKREAEVRFERGVELYREGSLDAALVELERAYQLIADYRLLFNLAQIQADRHDYDAALGMFQRYLKAGGSEISESRRAETEEEMAKLQTRIAHLMVESNVPGAKLFVDDAHVATLPLTEAVVINSGVRELRLEAAGYDSRTKRIKVAGDEHPTHKLTLIESGSVSVAEPATPRVTEKINYTPLSIAAAATVVLGGAAVGFGLAAAGASDDLDAALGQFPAVKSEVDSARSRLKLYSALNIASGATALVALGCAVYFLIDPPKRQIAESEPSRARLQLLPSPQGLVLHATF